MQKYQFKPSIAEEQLSPKFYILLALVLFIIINFKYWRKEHELNGDLLSQFTQYLYHLVIFPISTIDWIFFLFVSVATSFTLLFFYILSKIYLNICTTHIYWSIFNLKLITVVKQKNVISTTIKKPKPRLPWLIGSDKQILFATHRKQNIPASFNLSQFSNVDQQYILDLCIQYYQLKLEVQENHVKTSI